MRSATPAMQNTNQRKRKDTTDTGYTGVYIRGKLYRWEVRYNGKLRQGGGLPTAIEALMNRNLYIIENNWPNRLERPDGNNKITIVVNAKDPRTWKVCLTDDSGRIHTSETRRLDDNLDKTILNKLVKSLRN